MTTAKLFIAEYGRYCQSNDLTCPTLSEAGVQAALSVVGPTSAEANYWKTRYVLLKGRLAEQQPVDEPRPGPIPHPYSKSPVAGPKHIDDQA